VPVGDHDVDPQHYRWLAHRFAEAIAPHNAQLAGHLAWLHHEAGGTRLSDPDPRPFPWRSGGVTGLGHCLRCDSGTHEELLLLRAGGAWAHHHADNGSLWLYSHGRGIITDVAGGGIPASGMAKAAAGSHSRWLPDGGTPIDVLWRHHRGWIQESDDAAAHPWALAWCPVRAIAGEALAREGMRGIQHLTRCIRHQRLSVQLAPGVWLVLDHTPDAAGRVRFHCALPMPPRQVYGGVSGEPRPGLGLSLVPLAPTAITIAGREASERQPALGTVAVDIATRPGWSGCIIAVGAATDVAVVSATGRWTAIVNGRRWDIAREDGRWTITGPTGCTTIPIPDCPDHADEG
jgi:hypothetical protein